MQKVSDAGLPPGLALPDFAYPQHNHEPAAILNEDITVMEVQQQLDRLHNAVLLAKLACRLSLRAMPRRLRSLGSLPRLINWPPLWQSFVAACSEMLMCLPA